MDIKEIALRIAEKDERIAELETYLKSETKDKESAQESFGTAWSKWQRCEKRIAQLEKQRDELLADAERYRVLRDSEYQLDEDDPSVSDSFFNQYFGEELDAAVDDLKSRFDSTIARSKGEQ